jgi:hypothetical protein
MTTMQFTDIGYLEKDYAQYGYNSGDKLGALGFQCFVEIKDKKKIKGSQFQGQIVDAPEAHGFQFHSEIVNFPRVFGAQALGQILNQMKIEGNQFEAIINMLKIYGFQFHVLVNSQTERGMQFLNETTNQPTNHGFQVEVVIDTEKVYGFEMRKDNYQSYPITGYLDDDYLSGPYLTGYFGPRFPTQFLADCLTHTNRGFQTEVNIIDMAKVKGEQARVQIVDTLRIHGFQFRALITQPRILAFQFQSHIIDKLKIYGTQFLANLQKQHANGFQFQVTTQIGIGFQFLSTIYNTQNLRILSNMKSRGLTNTNWTSNSTMPGDFSPNNFDSDIVEYVWRSASTVKTGIKLTCDIGLNQICYADTVAILNHNMTVGADIKMLMSNDPAFITGVTVVQIRARRLDTYYIAPSLPTAGFRYFQFQIDDPSNSNSYIEIGNIMFGASDIIHGENFTDEVDFEMQDFSDSISTEGHTNVMNSRALKRKLTLNFESLNYEKRNYQILREVFRTYRTSHKCLWIPTPDVLDQNLTDRFRIFGKLTVVPKERHNNKGPGADLISFTVDLDESL